MSNLLLACTRPGEVPRTPVHTSTQPRRGARCRGWLGALLTSIALPLAAAIVPAAAATAPPCPTPTDECFERLEAEQRKRGELGYSARPTKEHPDALYVVATVTRGGPADGRLEPGDAILAIGGESIEQSAEGADRFSTFHRDLPAGAEVVYTVLRDGERLEVELVAAPRSRETAEFWLKADLAVTHGQAWYDAYEAYLARRGPAGD